MFDAGASASARRVDRQGCFLKQHKSDGTSVKRSLHEELLTHPPGDLCFPVAEPLFVSRARGQRRSVLILSKCEGDLLPGAVFVDDRAFRPACSCIDLAARDRGRRDPADDADPGDELVQAGDAGAVMGGDLGGDVRVGRDPPGGGDRAP